MIMDLTNKKILAALQIQPLSEKEKLDQHILGRLCGPIATCSESTRNGRLYSKPLWEKALKDEVFLEKVATKALFLELGHPTDREETDMKQVCACIPAVPQIIGDDLYAYVDILDTPNGRLLKTLVDYGFIPGISSRGSGDVMDNNQVDPETFFLETWDIVQLPAVKKARLNVCESLDTDGARLKKALAESYRTANDEDKNAMKEALENLNIDIAEDLDADIPWDNEDDEPVIALFEDTDEDTEESSDSASDTPEDAPEAASEENVDDIEDDTVDTDALSTTSDTDEILDDQDTIKKADDEEVIVDVNAIDELDIDTVGDAIKMLQGYDKEIKIKFDAVQLGDQKYPVEKFSSFLDEDGEEQVLILGVDCGQSETDFDFSDDADEDIEVIEPAEEPVDDAAADGTDSDDTADDDGDAEVIESLKEIVRQKEALETELNTLRKTSSVGDAKVRELQEKLSQYRTAFSKVSAEAARVPELQAKVLKLNEHLKQSRKTINTLTEKVNSTQQLKESAEATATVKNKMLNEQVERLSQQNKLLEAKLEDQAKQYKAKLLERTEVAKAYKKRCAETLTRYIESKASMLGVASSEITSRLNESYTLSDVDAVCDTIMNSTVNLGRLPFGGRSRASARISESVHRNTSGSAMRDPAYGYDIDDSLLELAGLK